MLKLLPISLILFRFLLGPLLFVAALDGHTGAWLGIGLFAALGSDIFDGVIARRVGVATPRLRELDSWVDFLFCLWIAACLWVAHQETVSALAPFLVVWLTTNVLALTFDWLKYRRFAAYHAYSSKLGGLLLFVAGFTLFTVGSNQVLLTLALVAAIISHLERMVITAVMPTWTPDIWSFWFALQLQRAES